MSAKLKQAQTLHLDHLIACGAHFGRSYEDHVWDLTCAECQKRLDLIASVLAADPRRTALAEAQAALERDRSAVAKYALELRKALNSREWLKEGRGPYEWDDDNWHKEFAAAWQEFSKALEPLEKIGADFTNCPKTSAEAALALAGEPPAAPQCTCSKEGICVLHYVPIPKPQKTPAEWVRVGLNAAAKFCESDLTADQQADWNKTDEALEFWLAKQIMGLDAAALVDWAGEEQGK